MAPTRERLHVSQVLYTPVKKPLMVQMADILGGANCSVFTTAAEREKL